MKKHLIAAAVAAAVAAPAMAQNVAIYGTLDVTYAQTNSTTDTADVFAQAGANLGTSVLGLKGSEDLGGGMKVAFDLQGELQADSGTSTSTQNSFFFNRQSWVSVSNALGTFKAGRTGTLVDQSYSAAAMGWNLFLPAAASRGNQKVPGVTEVTTNVAGITFQAQNINANPSVAQESALNYKLSGKLAGADLAYATEVQNVAAGTKLTTTWSSVGYQVTSALKVVAALGSKKAENSATTNTSHANLGAAYSLGGGVEVAANYQNFNDKNSTTTDYKQLGVAVKKDLSKRTTVYAGMKSQDFKQASVADVDTYTVGLQHSF